MVHSYKCRPGRPLQPTDRWTVLRLHAEELNPWFQDVVRGWARSLTVGFQEAKVKREQRVVEKVTRSYGGDFRKVLDMLRSTLQVATISDVYRTLGFILAQPNVLVYRIKNRFDPKFNAKETFGYRDLNMQISFVEFQDSVFAGHICELQIHIVDMLKLKTEQGHQNYVQYRNL